jgi:hypothetical protein
MLHCAEIFGFFVIAGVLAVGFGGMWLAGRGSRDEEENPFPSALRNYIDREDMVEDEWQEARGLSGNSHDRRITRRAIARRQGLG